VEGPATVKRKIVVIGAGMGGLAAAARLATRGHDVTVVEQGPTYGGKLASYERDGFRFDLGPSLFTLPAIYRDLFLKTGRPLEDHIELVELDPAFRYRFGDGSTLLMPGVGVGRCANAIADALGGQSGNQWSSFMQRAARMWDVTRESILSSPLDGMRTLLPLARSPRDVLTIAPWSSLRSMSRSYFTDPRLVTLTDRYATYTGSDPRRAPAALATIPYVEQTFGAFHLAGGLRRLGDAVHDRACARGATFEFNTRVESITVNQRVTGVRTSDGRVILADAVIANADASHTYEYLLADMGADPRRMKPWRSLRRATASLSGFCLLLAVEGQTPDIEHHNVWFPSDYDAEFNSVFGQRGHATQPVEDPTIYACVPKDSSMAPPGHEAWFVLINAPRHGDGTAQTFNWNEPGAAESYADHILQVLATRGVDLRERILWRVVRTPADLERETGSPGGAIYGSSSNGRRSAFLRPANSSPVPGLYLVGGSSHPGGGLPLVGLSADIVATLVTNDFTSPEVGR
jgi:phytoene desaturase